MPQILELLILSLIGSLVALIGGIIFLYIKKTNKILEQHSVPFAAGVLITVSILGLLPESLELINEKALWVLLSAFFGSYLFEHLFFGVHHHYHDCNDKNHSHISSVPLVILGDTIHNFIDGVSIGVSYFISPGLGLITAISTLLHEVPHEIGDFGILLKSGWKKTDIVAVNVLSASVTILGAFSVYLYAGNEAIIGNLLAISAGIFLYLGASDFLPHISTNSKSKLNATIPLIIGSVAIIITLFAIPHSH